MFGRRIFGLTGTRLDGAEMLACGLATHFVPSVVVLHFNNLILGIVLKALMEELITFFG